MLFLSTWDCQRAESGSPSTMLAEAQAHWRTVRGLITKPFNHGFHRLEFLRFEKASEEYNCPGFIHHDVAGDA